MTSEDRTDELLECYKPSDDLTNTLYEAMEAYIQGDKSAGDAKMGDTKPLFKNAFKDCGELKDSMGAWSKKTDDLVKRDDWA